MLKRSCSVLMLMVALFAQAALASDNFVQGQEGYFLGVHAGGVFPAEDGNSLNNGYSVGAEYGYRVEHFRTALTLDYIRHDFSSPTTGSYDLFNIMTDFYYDVNYAGTVVPFVGAGIGYVDAWQDNCSDGGSQQCAQVATGSHLGYQGLAGIGLQHQQFRFDVQYRYFSFTSSNDFYDNIIEAVFSIFI